jgi:hypothetical protein
MMAGLYPDVPGPRMAYDRDGSVGFRIDSGVVTQMNSVETRYLNDEGALSGQGDNTTRQYGVVFPELRDVIGVYWATASGGDEPARAVETSTDTTSGLDGSWVTRIAGTPPQTYGTSVSPDYRLLIQVVAWNGVRAIRWTAGRVQWAFHVYGSPSATAYKDRLRMWDPTFNNPLAGAALDFGESPRHSSADRQFRIKNTSLSKTASGISVIAETLTDTSPSLIPQVLLSSDGVRFTQTLSLGTLGPGALTSKITVRRVTPLNAQLGLGGFRVVATADVFT